MFHSITTRRPHRALLFIFIVCLFVEEEVVSKSSHGKSAKVVHLRIAFLGMGARMEQKNSVEVKFIPIGDIRISIVFDNIER